MLSSIQRELNSFFKKLRNETYDIHEVTKGGLTQARSKLKAEAFVELSNKVVHDFYSNEQYCRWHGFRLIAIDGSTCNLPSHKSIEAHFGLMQVGCKKEVNRSMARISMCYDVLNLMTLDAQIAPFTTSENILLSKHLERVRFNEADLVLADRGYPSIGLMFRLTEQKINFCFRMKSSWWKEVDAFNQSTEQTCLVEWNLPKKDHGLISNSDAQTAVVKVRLVKVMLDTGEIEILATSLLDEQLFPNIVFKELYHYRWNIEEGYKLFKECVQLEVFSGKTALAVMQDFFAKLFMLNVCAMMSFPIEQKVREESKKNKHQRQINKTSAVAFIKSSWVALWERKYLNKFFISLTQVLLKATDIIRPGRKFSRNKTAKKPPPMNRKTICV